MNDLQSYPMLLLAGEQTAPNLLPARHYKPRHVHILHTKFRKSKLMAERLELRLAGMNPHLHLIDAYKPGEIVEQITELLVEMPDALVNITGGTKPMSIGALAAAYKTGSQPFYVRSQRGKTELDFYDFTVEGTPFVRDTVTIGGTISIDDYLVAYFGTEYQFTGFGSGPGETLERAVYETLESEVDEIKAGWKHKSGAVDVDAIVRCNNQVGIIEAKTGRKARSTDGIKQLAVAGGQRFFGTYTKRFLVIDQDWSERSNNRALADAIGIIVIELPGFAKSGGLDGGERYKLVEAIHQKLGKPLHLQEGSQ